MSIGTPMDTIYFTVVGTPGTKQRPKFAMIAGHPRAYTPKDTVLWENRVRACFELAAHEQGAALPVTDYGSVSLVIDAWYPISKSWPKWKREFAASGRMEYTGRRDWDNCAKAIADSLNGLAFKDDAHISHAVVSQRYSEKPRVVVRIIYKPVVTKEYAKAVVNELH